LALALALALLHLHQVAPLHESPLPACTHDLPIIDVAAAFLAATATTATATAVLISIGIANSSFYARSHFWSMVSIIVSD
jgi:hypothetical protein